MRLAGAKQQILKAEYVVPSEVEGHLCTEPQARGVSPQGDVKELFFFVVLVYFVVEILSSAALRGISSSTPSRKESPANLRIARSR